MSSGGSVGHCSGAELDTGGQDETASGEPAHCTCVCDSINAFHCIHVCFVDLADDDETELANAFMHFEDQRADDETELANAFRHFEDQRAADAVSEALSCVLHEQPRKTQFC